MNKKLFEQRLIERENLLKEKKELSKKIKKLNIYLNLAIYRTRKKENK